MCLRLAKRCVTVSVCVCGKCVHTLACVHACVSAFGGAGREYLNNSLINIRGRFIGFEAYLPFVGKH